MTIRRPPRTDIELSWTLRNETVEKLTEYGREVYGRGTSAWVARLRRGTARYSTRRITVPAWAFDQNQKLGGGQRAGGEFPTYYLAHELAHLAVHDAHGEKARWLEPHGPEFMDEFKKICPPELWHFETGYKPRNSRKAGISASPERNLKRDLAKALAPQVTEPTSSARQLGLF